MEKVVFYLIIIQKKEFLDKLIEFNQSKQEEIKKKFYLPKKRPKILRFFLTI